MCKRSNDSFHSSQRLHYGYSRHKTGNNQAITEWKITLIKDDAQCCPGIGEACMWVLREKLRVASTTKYMCQEFRSLSKEEVVLRIHRF